MDNKIDKGYALEEAVRFFFLESGYFVVRGVPFTYRGLDVTDIDIWAYDRSSALSRYRVIVDCKNKSTPRAIERIFWTKGLKEALGVDAAAVATTERRAEITDFGRRNGVMVLDGNFISETQKQWATATTRLTEEEFNNLLNAYAPVKGVSEWRMRVRNAKQPLATSLNFSSANLWIDAGRYFAEQMSVVSTQREVACRVVYLLLSYTAIALDFSLREFAVSESSQRFAVVEQGLRHGAPGIASTGSVLSLAVGLIEHYAPENKGVATKVRQRLAADLDQLPTKMLAEYICKPSVALDLFPIAKHLESAAYVRKFVPPASLGVPVKSFLLLFLDFWGIDRNVIDVFSPSDSSSPSTEPSGTKMQASGSDIAEKISKSDQSELPGFEQLPASEPRLT